MSFHKDMTVEQLHRALERNPDGVRRLAQFVCARTMQPHHVLEACQEQRRTQVLATRGRRK